MEQAPFPQQSQPAMEKAKKVQELLVGQPEVFFILTGAMKENKDNAKSAIKPYESGAFIDPDQNSGLATGGKDRMLAAVELHQMFPEAKVVPMSRTKDNRPTYASIMRGELEAKGIHPDMIIEESASVDTITELKEAARMSEENEWQEIAFISSDFHLPRAKALLNHVENFADTPEEVALLARFAEAIRLGALRVQFVGSGEVLKLRSPHYNGLLARVEQDERMKQRIELEERALDQIKAGTYAEHSLTKKIFPEDTGI